VVTVDRVVLHDTLRNKDLAVKIYYPEGAGPFPVIVFSHGALASKECYSGLGSYWASFGYVSIHPSHDDSIADSGFRGTLQQAISDPHAWENRPKDISFIIDSLPEIERLVPPLSGKLDSRKIGVGGHSFGAYTAELVGGTTIVPPGKDEQQQSFKDPRVEAILVLSPQGEGRMGLTARSWDNLRLPMLLMYGSLDYGAWGEAPVWRSEAYQMAPRGNKYEVELNGGRHMGFAGPSTGAVQNEVFECTKLETLAFWDAYLKKDKQAKEYLDSNGLKKFSMDFAKFAAK
jgi:predicted dienelactone hydrolase